MIILVPYFGELAKFRPLLYRWLESFRRLSCPVGEVQPVIISDDHAASKAALDWDVGFRLVDISAFADVRRPGVAFDHKGAIVCAALLEIRYPVLVLDADAFLARDPSSLLMSFPTAPIAMPLDHGAIIHFREVKMDPPYHAVPKMCAGVQWFGDPLVRAKLVAAYKAAWTELIELPKLPWTPPISNLIEQYAWSLVAHRLGGKVLPATMNWAPHHVGPNPLAIVNHYFDYKKWKPGVLPELVHT